MKSNIFILGIAATILSSCSVSIPNANFSVSDQHMEGSGYRVVRKVEASASTPYIFNFIGGFGRTPLIDRARAQALEKADLKPGQSFAFETINDKVSCFILFSVRTATFRAYVIEPDGTVPPAVAMSVQADEQEIKPPLTTANSIPTPQENLKTTNDEIRKYKRLLSSYFKTLNLSIDASKFNVKIRYNSRYVVMTDGVNEISLTENFGIWKAKGEINGTKYPAQKVSE